MLIKEESFQVRRPAVRTNGLTTKRPPRLGSNPTKSRWDVFIFGFLLLATSTFLSGLITLRGNLLSNYQQKFEAFRWIVMVQGDQLQSDEVGRYLKQLDGVTNVVHVPSIQAFQVIIQNPLFSGELKEINPEFLPNSWEVQWAGDETVTVDRLKDIFIDVSELPGVTDVAYDVAEWNDIQSIKTSLTQLRLVLSIAALLGIVWASLLIGRLMFFTPLVWIGTKTFLGIFIGSTAFWSMGFLMAGALLGYAHWSVLVVGAVIGLTRAFWECRAISNS